MENRSVILPFEDIVQKIITRGRRTKTIQFHQDIAHAGLEAYGRE